MKILLGLLITLGFSGTSFSSEKPLEQQLDELKMPSNKAPQAVSEEKLYSVQTRYNPLSKTHEITLSGAKDFASNGYLNTNQMGLGYRYHFNDRWSIVGKYVRVFNELNNSGEALLKEEKLISDADYLISQFDVGAEVNLFYGKFRLDMSQVLYFDQYVGLSGGVVEKRRGMAPTVAVDAGLAFWLGKQMSMRAGVKNSFFEEENGIGEKAWTRSMTGYFSIGYLYGSI